MRKEPMNQVQYNKIVLIFILLYNTIFIYGQSEIITGTITDNQGIPLPGVNIIEETRYTQPSLCIFNFIVF